jgi:uncharacterized MAPEG superfamily protein
MIMTMPTTLIILAWTLVFALAHIALVGAVRSRETGMKYNMGARDEPAPPPGKVTARLMRAQANLFETLPIFAIAVLIAHVSGRDDEITCYGAMLYLGARIVYVPLYAAGTPILRSVVWGASIAGIAMIIKTILV